MAAARRMQPSIPRSCKSSLGTQEYLEEALLLGADHFSPPCTACSPDSRASCSTDGLVDEQRMSLVCLRPFTNRVSSACDRRRRVRR